MLRGIFRPWVLERFLDDNEIALVMSSEAAFWKAFGSQSPVVDGVPDAVLDKMVENLTFVAAVTELESDNRKTQAVRGCRIERHRAAPLSGSGRVDKIAR